MCRTVCILWLGILIPSGCDRHGTIRQAGPIGAGNMASGSSLISGVVQDLNGNPVANARVYFTSSPVALPDIAALTDGAGRFMLTAPQPGQYTIACAADGWETKSVAVTVTGGKTKELKIQLTARRTR